MKRWMRKIHYWGSIVIAIPILIIIVSGLLLQVKKQFVWVQPATKKGQGKIPTISFAKILDVAKTVPQSQIVNWEDIDRLDVRPDKGVVKVRCKNSWEIQIDHQTGKIVQIAYRRSDLIESIHDGSFFHLKLWGFLPSAVILLILWITGIYLFILPLWSKRKKKKKKA